MAPAPVHPDPLGRLQGLCLWGRALAFDLGTSRAVSSLSAALLDALYRIVRLTGNREKALRVAMLAHRLSLRVQLSAAPTALQDRIEQRLRASLATGAFSHLARPPADSDFSGELERRAMVLKVPRLAGDGRVTERGVFLITFTHLFGELAHQVDVAQLTREYTLVLEPSWSGYAIPEILQFAETAVTPVFVMATEPRDFAFLERFDPQLVPLPFGASNWVDPEVFRPTPGWHRVFDAGYIGFWGAVKRHHALFRAMRRLGDPTYRVALIGGPWEGTRHEVAALARLYGVLPQLTFFEKLTPEEVSEVIGQCKVSLLLSRKEGSNRGLFESMFAGTPALLIRENLGVRKDYLTEETGRIVPERELASALRWFRDHGGDFEPRPWAMANISPTATTAALNEALRKHAAARGEDWTVDCVRKANRPEVTYLNGDDRRRLPSVAAILSQYARLA